MNLAVKCQGAGAEGPGPSWMGALRLIRGKLRKIPQVSTRGGAGIQGRASLLRTLPPTGEPVRPAGRFFPVLGVNGC